VTRVKTSAAEITPHHREPWLDKKEAAKFWACSPRRIEYAVQEGMPHAIIFGKVKLRISEAEPWLLQHGHLELRGERIYDGTDQENAPAAPVSRTPRGRTSEAPDAS
jgi:hypothetical protein